ncbi:MAG: sigma-70 family RNA polymerase sigma factor [Bacillota bacterium]|nr:sigma-70 family RNA polymerase sigma factor [Bacillota bacterium]
MENLTFEKAVLGDRNALAEILYDNYSFTYKFLVKLTYNSTLAEDLTQETMLRAIEKIHLYSPEKSKFSTWLLTIAQNIYVDYTRKHKYEQNYENIEDLIPALYSIKGEQNDSIRSMLEALKNIPGDTRIPIVLKHYYGYSYEEIASIMSIPPGTVKSRIHNGISLLRKELEPDEN